MSAKKLPHFGEKQIRQLATSQSFSRGEKYYHDDLIENPTLQGLKLWADCYGTQLYQVSIDFEAWGPFRSSRFTALYH